MNKTGSGNCAQAGQSAVIPIIIAASRTARPIAYPVILSSAHFLTTSPRPRLFLALVGSLVLHALPFLPGLLPPPAPVELPPPLSVALPPLPPSPPLLMPAATRPPAPTPPPAAAKPLARSGAPAPTSWTQVVRRHLQELDRQGQFYPAEAIARGLQGEVVVLLVLDESGAVIASRVEQGSGHAMLDDAALRAVRSLHSLPADAPRQALLPVRFRLH